MGRSRLIEFAMQSTREERAADRVLQRSEFSLESLIEQESADALEKTTLGWENKCMDKRKATMLWAHTGLKNTYDSPPTRMEMLIIHRASGRVLRKCLLNCVIKLPKSCSGLGQQDLKAVMRPELLEMLKKFLRQMETNARQS